MTDELTPDEIEALLRQGKRRTGVRKAKQVERVIPVWWKLQLHLTLECSNPNCVDPRKGEFRGACTATVDGLEMCRYCFLAGYGREAVNG